MTGMLVIKVELWPGGDARRACEIGCMALANVSSLAATSDYVTVTADDLGDSTEQLMTNHRRGLGFWPLVAQAAQVAAEHARRRETFGETDLSHPPLNSEPAGDDHASTIAAVWDRLRDHAVGVYRPGP